MDRSKGWIWQQVGIPKSTLNYIIKNQDKINKISGDSVSEDLNRSKLSLKQKQWIDEYVRPPTYPTTLSQIINKLELEFKTPAKKRDVKAYLKKEANFSFKKGSLRHSNSVLEKNLLFQVLFNCNFLSQILDSKYLFNIDECCFNRDVKQQYSWLPKGFNSSILSSEFTQRWSVIWGLGIDGEYLSILVNDTVTSDDFIWYLRVLFLCMKHRKIKLKDEWLLLLDNAKIHLSNISVKNLNSMSFHTLFLSPYCPQFAPIESLFKQLKAKFKKMNVRKKINFNKESGYQAIHESFTDLKQNDLKRIWNYVIKNWKKCLKDYWMKI